VTGTALADAVVLGKVSSGSSDSSIVSVATDSDGDWLFDLGSVRTADYDSYFDYEQSDTLVLTGLAAGDSDVKSYTISDTDGEVLGLELNINKEGESTIAELPETAINGIAAVALTVSLVLIIYGVVILGNYYNEERRYRWEKDFIRNLEE